MSSGPIVALVRWIGLSAASLALLGSALGVAYGWPATASQTAQAQIGTWTGTGAPAVPRECAGMTFYRVILGTPGNDHLHADSHGDLIYGLGGNDEIKGGKGRDCLVGGDGNDELSGAKGKDVLIGGNGNMALVDPRSPARAWVDEEDERAATHGWRDGQDHLDGGPSSDNCYGTRHDTYIRCERVLTGREPGHVVPDSDGQPIAPAPLPLPPVPFATPAPTDGPSPTAPSQAATPDPTDGPAPTPTATMDPVPDPTAVPTAPPTAEPTPDPTAAPTPDPTAAPTPEATPDPTPAANPDPTAVPTPDPAPAPTATPDPTP